MPYQRPVTSRCYVTTFRSICDAFCEIIDDEVIQILKQLHIHQFLKFPAFQQCIPLLYEILKLWNASEEGFVIVGYLIKFTSDEVALLTGLPNRGDIVNWKNEPFLGILSTDIKTEMANLSRTSDNAYKIKTYILFLVSNLFLPLNNHKTPKRLMSIASNLDEFSSINWAASIRNFMVQEFNIISNKLTMDKPLGYINGFLPLLLIWVLEHFYMYIPSDPDLRPRFLRWEGNTDIFYTQTTAMNLLKFLKKKEVRTVLVDVSVAEAENMNADINAIQNFEIATTQDSHIEQTPHKKNVARAPQSPRAATPKAKREVPFDEQPNQPPEAKTEDWASVQNKLLSALENMCSKIENGLNLRIERIEDDLDKLQCTVESLEYKLIHHLSVCQYDPEKPSIASSSSSIESVQKPKIYVRKATAKPQAKASAVNPPSKEGSLPDEGKNKDDRTYEPHKNKRKREGDEQTKKKEKSLHPSKVISVDNIKIKHRPADLDLIYPGKEFLPEKKQILIDRCFKKFTSKDDVIFTSGHISISRADIDEILTNGLLADNHVDAFAFLLSEKAKIRKDKYQPYLYVSPLYRVYKFHDLNHDLFIKHVTPEAVRASNLIVQPVVYGKHWVLLVGKKKEKVWSIYDSLPNAEHKKICYKVINYMHEDMAASFSSDILKWRVQFVRGIPTQANEVDCGMFVCKYMDHAILKEKTDWTTCKDWQNNMPKFRAEFVYTLLFIST